MFQHKCVDDGIVQVLIGMAGQDLDSGSYSGAEWSLYHDQQFGYTTIYANQTIYILLIIITVMIVLLINLYFKNNIFIFTNKNSNSF